MRFIHLSFLVFLLGATAARADVTIVQKVESGDGSSTVTLKVKGEKARVEINPKLTTLLDSRTGDLTMLMNDEKQVMRISGEKAKAMAEMAKAMAKDATANDAPPKATGRKQKINGYDTEAYESKTPKSEMTYWVAKEYPGGDAVMKQMAVLRNGAFAAIRKGMPDFTDLPGLPLRTEIKVNGASQMTSTIESVSQDRIPDSEFAIPSDYSEMKMPDIFGGKKPPGEPKQ
jgi:uncharacterized protein DUF4412